MVLIILTFYEETESLTAVVKLFSCTFKYNAYPQACKFKENVVYETTPQVLERKIRSKPTWTLED